MSTWSSMPSGRSAAFTPGNRDGKKPSDFAGRLLDERTGKPVENALMQAGKAPVSPMGNNLLASAPAMVGNKLLGAAAPGPVGNLLTGQPAPTQVALPDVPAAAPQPGPAVTMAVVPGQERHTAIGKDLGADKLTDDELASRLDRSMFVQTALRGLLDKGTPIDHGDAAQVLADGVKSAGIPASDVPAILASLPADPTKMRQAIERLHEASLHAAVHLVGEQTRRSGAKQ